ncbi:MAG: iron-sulfur cluster assembly accessory protein [Pirellulales bacterium]
MIVTLTEKAAEQAKKYKEENEAYLRIGVVGGGCSGFEYMFKWDDQFDEARDTKTEQHGVPVVVDKKSALYLEGTTIDYYESMEKQGFTFNNPNAVKSCGCGSSFQA